MIPSQAQQYLSSLRFDPHAVRSCCYLPLGGIVWSDEIPDFNVLSEMPDDDRQWVYRVFAIRFRLWAKETLSPEEDSFWRHCEMAFPDCPILRRTVLDPVDQKAQDECVAEMVEVFGMLFSLADEVEIKEGPHGIQGLTATIELGDRTRPRSWWKRIQRLWGR